MRFYTKTKKPCLNRVSIIEYKEVFYDITSKPIITFLLLDESYIKISFKSYNFDLFLQGYYVKIYMYGYDFGIMRKLPNGVEIFVFETFLEREDWDGRWKRYYFKRSKV